MFHLPPPINLFDYLCENIPKSFFSTKAFVIGCQHILPSTRLMINKMIDHGLKKYTIALIGKCYSTSLYTFKKMSNEGIYIFPQTTTYNSHQAFDDKFNYDVQIFLKNQLKRKDILKDSFIILFDDGGQLISCIQHTYPEYRKVLAIE